MTNLGSVEPVYEPLPYQVQGIDFRDDGVHITFVEPSEVVPRMAWGRYVVAHPSIDAEVDERVASLMTDICGLIDVLYTLKRSPAERITAHPPRSAQD